ncbi:MAG: alpha-L-fucosidase [Firmicutes bacterium]|nr:alpha-L-fucosidase [Bacillota bacterium]
MINGDFTAFYASLSHVRPSARQLAWFDTEFYAFVHFGVNTFTNREWGDGTEDPAIFNPAQLDPDQWVRAVKAAGMKGLILTAKHHDGFCLWPSKYTEHSVKNSPLGRDVVGETAAACRRGGIKFGFYLSPWDRNCAVYGSEAYNDYYCHQLEELLTGYGEIFCVWFDGACGEGPNGKKQEYDFPRYIRLIRELQPNAVIFNDHGPDIRWIGNESGQSRHAEWAVLPSELCWFSEVQTGPGPLEADLSYMYNPDPDIGALHNLLYSMGVVYCPAETDMSIRPGWFYHPDEQPHSLERLFDTYLRTVGGNSCLNLNIPPDTRGLLADADVQRLSELGALIRKAFASEVGNSARVSQKMVSDFQIIMDLCWDAPQDITFVVLQEDISQGQRVENFQLRAAPNNSDSMRVIYQGTTIGHKKICPLTNVKTDRTTDELFTNTIRTSHLQIAITASRGTPLLLQPMIYIL